MAWQDLTRGTRRGIADGILNSEVRRLARLLVVDPVVQADGAPLDEERIVDAVAEVVASFEVYRTYLPEGIHHLIEALEVAAESRPDLADVIDRIAPALCDGDDAAAIRLQQTSGMVMAKGVEDTAFYRTSRLSSLSEVGGDPSVFAVTLDEFHAAQRERLASWPLAMTTLTTHDTKRSEDTRARIAVLAELGEEWTATFDRLNALAPLEDGVFANLLWQAIVGARPASRERLHAYAEKASREAGDSTTWTEPDEAFEQQMHALVDASFDDPAVVAELDALDERVTAAGWSNGLGAKILHLTAPGVPDVYQGTEAWDRSLVDPDNRRPVDYAERRRVLATLDGADHDGPDALPGIDLDAAAKTLVTSRALRLRRDHPEALHPVRPARRHGHGGRPRGRVRPWRCRDGRHPVAARSGGRRRLGGHPAARRPRRARRPVDRQAFPGRPRPAARRAAHRLPGRAPRPGRRRRRRRARRGPRRRGRPARRHRRQRRHDHQHHHR